MYWKKGKSCTCAWISFQNDIGLFLDAFSNKTSAMELSTFLNSQGWQSSEEFGVEIIYQGTNTFASVSEYKQNASSVFLATLSDGKELLLVSNNHAV